MSSLLLSFWTDLCNIVSGFFAIIPQTLYFLYASAASVLDMLQYLVRKLAGLDNYYVDGQAQSGDILVEFIEGIQKEIGKDITLINSGTSKY